MDEIELTLQSLAMVKDGEVKNIAVYAVESPGALEWYNAQIADGYTLIDVTGQNVKMYDLYIDGQFSSPQG